MEKTYGMSTPDGKLSKSSENPSSSEAGPMDSGERGQPLLKHISERDGCALGENQLVTKNEHILYKMLMLKRAERRSLIGKIALMEECIKELERREDG